MPGTILLICHGETAWNREKIFRGIYDVALNENDRDQSGQGGFLMIGVPGNSVDSAE